MSKDDAKADVQWEVKSVGRWLTPDVYGDLNQLAKANPTLAVKVIEENAEYEKLIKEGWEPFSVTPDDMHQVEYRAIFWLRRKKP